LFIEYNNTKKQICLCEKKIADVVSIIKKINESEEFGINQTKIIDHYRENLLYYQNLYLNLQLKFNEICESYDRLKSYVKMEKIINLLDNVSIK